MAIVFQCECGRPLRASPEAAGKKTKCPGCNKVLMIPGGTPKPAGAATAAKAASDPSHDVLAALAVEDDPFAPALDWSTIEAPKPKADADAEPSSSFIKVDAAQTGSIHFEDVPRTPDGSKQYRVLGHKEQGVVGKFTPSRLEEVLNASARKGWSLKAAVVIDVPGHGGHHDELVVILER